MTIACPNQSEPTGYTLKQAVCNQHRSWEPNPSELCTLKGDENKLYAYYVAIKYFFNDMQTLLLPLPHLVGTLQ